MILLKDTLAFRAGTLSLGENVEDVIGSETLEETNLKIAPTDTIGVSSNPMCDPTSHRISVVVVGRLMTGHAKSGGDAESLEWLPADNETPLAFDHLKILQDYLYWKGYRGT
jgi:8-oxo-dGTP diphosphatase